MIERGTGCGGRNQVSFEKFGVSRAEPGCGEHPHAVAHPTRRFRIELMNPPTIGCGGITFD
jgi:hypothetical protein